MPQSASTIQASGRSGETCRQAGPYRAESRTALVVFYRSGDRFLNDAEGRATRWTLLISGIGGREGEGA
jgi:hypothetical protein